MIGYSNLLFCLPDFGYNYLLLVVGKDPSQGLHRRNQKLLCSFCTLYSLRFQHKQRLVARCSSSIHNREQRTSLHN